MGELPKRVRSIVLPQSEVPTQLSVLITDHLWHQNSINEPPYENEGNPDDDDRHDQHRNCRALFSHVEAMTTQKARKQPKDVRDFDFPVVFVVVD